MRVDLSSTESAALTAKRTTMHVWQRPRASTLHATGRVLAIVERKFLKSVASMERRMTMHVLRRLWASMLVVMANVLVLMPAGSISTKFVASVAERIRINVWLTWQTLILRAMGHVRVIKLNAKHCTHLSSHSDVQWRYFSSLFHFTFQIPLIYDYSFFLIR